MKVLFSKSKTAKNAQDDTKHANECRRFDLIELVENASTHPQSLDFIGIRLLKNKNGGIGIWKHLHTSMYIRH
jgi:hypothetical protein